MCTLWSSGTPVLYIGCIVPKGYQTWWTKFLFYNKFYFMPQHVSSTCARNMLRHEIKLIVRQILCINLVNYWEDINGQCRNYTKEVLPYDVRTYWLGTSLHSRILEINACRIFFRLLKICILLCSVLILSRFMPAIVSVWFHWIKLCPITKTGLISLAVVTKIQHNRLEGHVMPSCSRLWTLQIIPYAHPCTCQSKYLCVFRTTFLLSL